MKTTTQRTQIAKIKEQSVLASSKILHSLSRPIALDAPLIRLKESLYSSSEITIGRVSITITIIATTPHAFFTYERLDEIVFKESLRNPPTIGIKFPIANRAVRIDNESTLCVSTLWNDITNEKIDIKSTQAPVKVFLINLENPLRSTLPEIADIAEKEKDILITGISAIIMKFSTIVKKSINDAFDTVALEIEPVIIISPLITGANVFIVEQRACK